MQRNNNNSYYDEESDHDNNSNGSDEQPQLLNSSMQRSNPTGNSKQPKTPWRSFKSMVSKATGITNKTDEQRNDTTNTSMNTSTVGGGENANTSSSSTLNTSTASLTSTNVGVFGVDGNTKQRGVGGVFALAGLNNDDDSGDEWSDDDEVEKPVPPPPSSSKSATLVPSAKPSSVPVNTSVVPKPTQSSSNNVSSTVSSSGKPGFSFKDPTLDDSSSDDDVQQPSKSTGPSVSVPSSKPSSILPTGSVVATSVPTTNTFLTAKPGFSFKDPSLDDSSSDDEKVTSGPVLASSVTKPSSITDGKTTNIPNGTVPATSSNAFLTAKPGFSFKDPSLDDSSSDDEVKKNNTVIVPVQSITTVSTQPQATTVKVASSTAATVTKFGGFNFKDASLTDSSSDDEILPLKPVSSVSTITVPPPPSTTNNALSSTATNNITVSSISVDDPYVVMSEEDIELARLLEAEGLLPPGASQPKGIFGVSAKPSVPVTSSNGKPPNNSKPVPTASTISVSAPVRTVPSVPPPKPSIAMTNSTTTTASTVRTVPTNVRRGSNTSTLSTVSTSSSLTKENILHTKPTSSSFSTDTGLPMVRAANFLTSTTAVATKDNQPLPSVDNSLNNSSIKTNIVSDNNNSFILPSPVLMKENNNNVSGIQSTNGTPQKLLSFPTVHTNSLTNTSNHSAQPIVSVSNHHNRIVYMPIQQPDGTQTLIPVALPDSNQPQPTLSIPSTPITFKQPVYSNLTNAVLASLNPNLSSSFAATTDHGVTKVVTSTHSSANTEAPKMVFAPWQQSANTVNVLPSTVVPSPAKTLDTTLSILGSSSVSMRKEATVPTAGAEVALQALSVAATGDPVLEASVSRILQRRAARRQSIVTTNDTQTVALGVSTVPDGGTNVPNPKNKSVFTTPNLPSVTKEETIPVGSTSVSQLSLPPRLSTISTSSSLSTPSIGYSSSQRSKDTVSVMNMKRFQDTQARREALANSLGMQQGVVSSSANNTMTVVNDSSSKMVISPSNLSNTLLPLKERLDSNEGLTLVTLLAKGLGVSIDASTVSMGSPKVVANKMIDNDDDNNPIRSRTNDNGDLSGFEPNKLGSKDTMVPPPLPVGAIALAKRKPEEALATLRQRLATATKPIGPSGSHAPVVISPSVPLPTVVEIVKPGNNSSATLPLSMAKPPLPTTASVRKSTVPVTSPMDGGHRNDVQVLLSNTSKIEENIISTKEVLGYNPTSLAIVRPVAATNETMVPSTDSGHYYGNTHVPPIVSLSSRVLPIEISPVSFAVPFTQGSNSLNSIATIIRDSLLGTVGNILEYTGEVIFAESLPQDTKRPGSESSMFATTTAMALSPVPSSCILPILETLSLLPVNTALGPQPHLTLAGDYTDNILQYRNSGTTMGDIDILFPPSRSCAILTRSQSGYIRINTTNNPVLQWCTTDKGSMVSEIPLFAVTSIEPLLPLNASSFPFAYTCQVAVPLALLAQAAVNEHPVSIASSSIFYRLSRILDTINSSFPSTATHLIASLRIVMSCASIKDRDTWLLSIPFLRSMYPVSPLVTPVVTVPPLQPKVDYPREVMNASFVHSSVTHPPSFSSSVPIVPGLPRTIEEHAKWLALFRQQTVAADDDDEEEEEEEEEGDDNDTEGSEPRYGAVPYNRTILSANPDQPLLQSSSLFSPVGFPVDQIMMKNNLVQLPYALPSTSAVPLPVSNGIVALGEPAPVLDPNVLNNRNNLHNSHSLAVTTPAPQRFTTTSSSFSTVLSPSATSLSVPSLRSNPQASSVQSLPIATLSSLSSNPPSVSQPAVPQHVPDRDAIKYANRLNRSVAEITNSTNNIAVNIARLSTTQGNAGNYPMIPSSSSTTGSLFPSSSAGGGGVFMKSPTLLAPPPSRYNNNAVHRPPPPPPANVPLPRRPLALVINTPVHGTVSLASSSSSVNPTFLGMKGSNTHSIMNSTNAASGIPESALPSLVSHNLR